MTPAERIYNMTMPGWDDWFLAMCFLVAMRSPDRETKQGCVLVDWDSKVVIGCGYNGHVRGSSKNQAVTRPDKYSCMIHADVNALINCGQRSEHAVCYLPMPPCEGCYMLLANSPFVKIRRIVYLEERHFPKTLQIDGVCPHMQLVPYDTEIIHPLDLLKQAAEYLDLRIHHSAELSSNSRDSYTPG